MFALMLPSRSGRPREPCSSLATGSQSSFVLVPNAFMLQTVLSLTGGVVNRAIVIAAATKIVQHNNPAMLHIHGGSLELVLTPSCPEWDL